MMHLSELMVSCLIFLAVCTGLSSVYFSFMKNSGNAFDSGRNTVIVLKTDEKFRNYISGICIPYWENTEDYSESVKEGILCMEGLDESILICAVLKLYDGEGFFRGLKVEWEINGIRHVTEELFSSSPVVRCM